MKTRNSIWISIYILSISWLFMSPVFTAASLLGLVPVLCGIILIVYSIKPFETNEKLDRRYMFALIPIIIAALLVGFPYNVGLTVIAVGIAVPYLFKKISFAGLGLILSGTVLSFQSLLMPFYYKLAPRFHSFDTAGWILKWMLGIFGVKSSVEGSSLYIKTYTQTLTFSSTWEKFGIFILLHFIAGCILLLAISPAKRFKITIFASTVLVYVFIRYTLLTLMLINGGSISLFWSPIVTALSFAPLPLILTFLIPVNRIMYFRLPSLNKRFWLTAGIIFASTVLIIGIWGYHDAGTMKSGRVLFDEKHSDWEWSTEKYDTEWYNEQSGYNYYCLFQYLNLFYKTDRNFKPISKELLKNYDVLVVKTPTRAFTKKEIDSITDFVKHGGGLFLIGDHTNVFGISTNLNPLSEKFGIRFNCNATYELTQGGLSEYEAPKVLLHPIVRNLQHFLFATSCTLDAPLSAEDTITGYGLKAVNADYSQKNFFPSLTDTADMNFGLFLQDAAVKYGKGRVAAFTDSTVFSNFWMFMSGKPELALNTIDWLNRENRFPPLKYVFAALAVLFLIFAIYISIKSNKMNSIYAMLLGIILAIPVSILVWGALNGIGYKEVKEIKDYTRISFERQYSDYEMPSTWKGFLSSPDKQINTFYVWMQRLGYFPFAERTIKDGLDKGDLTVVINPDKHLSRKDKNAIKKAVLAGKKLLVMDSTKNNASTANEFIESFGMKIVYRKADSTEAYYLKDHTVNTGQSAGYIRGGYALLLTKDGKSLCSTVKVGKGSVTAFSDSEIFYNSVLGDVSQVPDQNQKKISELEFWMIKSILNNVKEADKK